MRVTAEELQKSGCYELVETLDYRSIVWFVIKHIKSRVPVMMGFYLFFILTIIGFGYISLALIIKGDMGIFSLMGQAILIICISTVPIIPLHELLHGAAFKILGAGKLVFGANLREMVFYVTVDRFVLDKKQFYFLALTPFVVFSLLFIPFLFVSSIYIQWIASFLLAFHTSCCIGDFGLMAYFSKAGKGADLYTYDDVTTKTSYFFRRIGSHA